MGNLKKKYEDIVSKRKEIIDQIEILKNDEKIIKYFELCSKNQIYQDEQKQLYKEMKYEEYSTCNHIWVKTLHEHDSYESRSYDYFGCMKCGLDQRAFLSAERRFSIDNFLQDSVPLTEERIMYNFMTEHRSYASEIDYDSVLCDLDLAKAIYSKIKQAHPDIDDETIKYYFKSALKDMREIKVNDERLVSRAKRLSLNPNFNKWNGRNVKSSY